MFFADNFWKDGDRVKIRTPSCFSRRDASKYVFGDPKRSSSKFDLGHVTSRSKVMKIGLNAYHSTRLDELNAMRPLVRLYLDSVSRYWQKNILSKKHALVLTPNTEIREKTHFILFFPLLGNWHKSILRDENRKLEVYPGSWEAKEKSILRSRDQGHSRSQNECQKWTPWLILR